MENEQAVVEQPDEQAPPVTEESNAQDLDLNNLLEEYSETGETEKKPQEKSTVNEDSETKQLLDMLKRQAEDNTRATATKELDEAVTSIRGDLNVDNKFVKAYLNMKADDDPRLRNAYIQRQNNPVAWAKIEQGLRADLQKFIGAIADKDLTETRDAVASSVLNSKSTSSDTETQVDLAKMSDVDFENYKAKLFKEERRAGRGGF